MKCRRCGEERQTLIWKQMKENEMWRVCPQCLDDIEWAERKMSQLNEEFERIFRRDKRCRQ